MDPKIWRDRIYNRMDQVTRLTHLTRGESDDEAFDILWKILIEQRLIGSGNEGFVVGDIRAVCFQEVPLYSIVENLTFEEELEDRKRYSWFGLRFNKIWIYKDGARPVFYGKTEELKRMLPKDQHWRIVNQDLDGDSIIDWSHEREWRIIGDYSFEWDDIEVLVKDDFYYRKFVEKCLSDNRTDILRGIHGIIPLTSVNS